MILPEARRQCAAGSQKKIQIDSVTSCTASSRSGILIHVDFGHVQQVKDAELVVLLQVV